MIQINNPEGSARHRVVPLAAGGTRLRGQARLGPEAASGSLTRSPRTGHADPVSVAAAGRTAVSAQLTRAGGWRLTSAARFWRRSPQ